MKIPKWLSNLLKTANVHCEECNTKYSDKDVLAIGYRKSSNKNGVNCPFVEFACPECGTITMIELIDKPSLSDEDINNFQKKGILDIIKKGTVKKEEEEEIKAGKEQYIQWSNDEIDDLDNGVITKKEIEEHKKFLNSSKCKTHYNFLINGLGFSPEEIE